MSDAKPGAKDDPLPEDILPAESVDESGSPLVEDAQHGAGGTPEPGGGGPATGHIREG